MLLTIKIRRFFALLCVFLLFPLCAYADLTVHFLNVGHGDCAILQSDGHVMVIDGGSSGKSDLIFSYLRDQGITQVDAVVETHPDADHIGGLPAVFHAATVQQLYVATMDTDASRHIKLIDKANEMGTPILVPENGDTIPLGSSTITFIRAEGDFRDDNDKSLVLIAENGDHRFLFCSDIEKKSENALMASGIDLSADVVKVAHHGTDASSSMPFLLAVAPRYAVISGNGRYASELDEVPSQLLTSGAELLHTLQNGHIIITSDGEKLQVDVTKHYVGNANSLVFHEASCHSVETMKSTNRVTIYTRASALHDGYRPCKKCKP